MPKAEAEDADSPELTRDAFVAEAIKAISQEGLERATLRSIAASLGRTTGSIFIQFAGRSDLLSAALAQALDDDIRFHDDLLLRLTDICLDEHVLAGVIRAYIEERRASVVGPFWAEILYKAADTTEAGLVLDQWVKVREDFWNSLMDRSNMRKNTGSVINAYITLEEAYALSLGGQFEYSIMLGDSVIQLARSCIHKSADTHSTEAISLWRPVATRDLPVRGFAESGDTVRDRLLDYAAEDIVADGVPKLNIRRVAKRARVSMSMISYYFGDTRSFQIEATWRALIRDIPAEVDPSSEAQTPLATLGEWTQIISKLIRPINESGARGFYIGVARLIGQASLYARTRPDLLPLVMHLRSIEGTGTHRASLNLWPPFVTISRSAATVFGIWVKGQAVLNGLVRGDAGAAGPEILEAVLPMVQEAPQREC